MNDRSTDTEFTEELSESHQESFSEDESLSANSERDPTAEFTFVPVVRSGYRPAPVFEREAETINAVGQSRINLDINGRGDAGDTTRTVSVGVSIYGPGAVTGIDTDQIVRMEPEPNTQEFPPNQFPLIEFDNPEIPWRYSPQRSDSQGRNRPWLCLVAVRDERIKYEPAGTGPLPVIETSTDELPDPVESWAWAHAQHVGNEDPEAAFRTDSTHTRSRLMCPRNLSSETKYRACVVPTFEPGRQAGLGLRPETDTDSIEFAWNDEALVRLPVYHSWTFRTDEVGDFEHLARLLEPIEFGPGIGFKTVDVSNPGPQKLKIPYEPKTDRGLVGLGGALRSTGAEPITYDESTAEILRKLLNQPREIEETTKAGEHGEEIGYGAVGPHPYGQWHAGVPKLENEDDASAGYYPRWFNELNADPRHRIAAGYGTRVIQKEQERLMQSAWEQFGDLREANRKLHRLQVDELVLTDRFEVFETLSTGTMLSITAPLHGSIRDRAGASTLLAQAEDSDLPTELASPAFRRMTRSTGPLARRLGTSVETASFTTRLQTGRVPRLTNGLDFTTESIPLEQDRAEETIIERGREILDQDLEPSDGVELLADIADPGAFFDSPALELLDTELQEEDEEDRLSAEVDQTIQPEDRPARPPLERETLPGSVQDAYAVLDHLDDEFEVAREAIATRMRAIQKEDANASAIEAAIGDSPAVQDTLERIEERFDSLEDAIDELLTEPRPAGIASDFDRGVADERLNELRRYHRRSASGFEKAIEAHGTDSANMRRVRNSLHRATDAVASMQGVTTRFRSTLNVPEEPAEDDIETTPLLDTDEDADEVGEVAREADVRGAQSIGLSTPRELSIPDTTDLQSAIIEGLEPTKRLYDHAGTVLGISDLDAREDPVQDVMAAPTFTEPVYRLLAELDEEYLLPGGGKIPENSMGTLVSNPVFIEAFMTGLNHEMARELQWHRFPTDRRGTYFRRFWNRKGNPKKNTADPEQMADIEPIHTWNENSLGENSPRDDEARIVLLIKGELLRRYPNTNVFAVKAIEDEGDRSPALPRTHVTSDDAEDDHIAYPTFRGKLSSNITFFGFPMTVEEALYAPYDRQTAGEHTDEGWFFVLQEPPGEPRFGLDVGTEEDIGEVPPGITDEDGHLSQLGSDEDAGPADHGWSAVSWAHLIDDGHPDAADFVDVADSRPGQESWRVEAGTSFTESGDHEYTREDAAVWGYNSSHMAITTWIRPVRVSIHAADMIPDRERDASRTPSRGAAARAKLVDYPRPAVRFGGGE